MEVPVTPEVRGKLVGFREAVTPEGEADGARLTVPGKPLRLVRVTADVVAEPEVTVRLDWAETMKSVTLTVTWTD